MSKIICGIFFLPLNGAVFWWFGNCFLVTFEEFQPYCNRKSRGPHGKIFWDYFSLANCEFVFHVSFSHSNSIGSFDIDDAGLLGFIWFFPHPSLFLSVLRRPPHLLLCPSHSLQPTPTSASGLNCILFPHACAYNLYICLYMSYIFSTLSFMQFMRIKSCHCHCHCPFSPLPFYMYPACPSLISLLVGWCRDRHWTVNLTPEEILTRGQKLIMIN